MKSRALVSKQHITSDIWTFWFENQPVMDYQAGQFIGLSLEHANPDDRGIHRWFTLSSSPTEQLLGITTRLAAENPSSFMQSLYSLMPGDTVTISDPMGDFVLPMSKKTPLLFVIAGIGITPVRSMLQWLKDSNQHRDITVLYSAANSKDFAYTDLLESAGPVRYFRTKDKANEKLTPDIVVQAAASQPTGLVYISGPEGFVEQMVADLRAQGLPAHRMVTDYFPGYDG